MKILKWLDKHFEEAISVFLMAGMTILVTMQVILREVGASLAWTEELTRYMFVWLIYISSSYAIRMRGHIKVELISLIVKEKGKLILDLISNVAFLIFAILIAIYGWQYVMNLATVRVQYSPSLHLPMFIPYTSFALGCSLMVIRLIQDTILRIREYKTERLTGEVN